MFMREKPEPRDFAVRYWMPNWGHGRSVEYAVDALQAAQKFVDAIKSKYGPDHLVVVTSVDEAK